MRIISVESIIQTKQINITSEIFVINSPHLSFGYHFDYLMYHRSHNYNLSICYPECQLTSRLTSYYNWCSLVLCSDAVNISAWETIILCYLIELSFLDIREFIINLMVPSFVSALGVTG